MADAGPASRRRLVEGLLKACESFADFGGLAEVGDGVGEGVVVFQAQERGEFFLIEFFYDYQWEPKLRFVHAIERFQGRRIAVDLQRGSLRDNVRLTRVHKVPNWKT